MGNKKNKKNSSYNTHRHAYIKKKLPAQIKAQIMDKTINHEYNSTQENTVNVQGSRIINMDRL